LIDIYLNSAFYFYHLSETHHVGIFELCRVLAVFLPPPRPSRFGTSHLSHRQGPHQQSLLPPIENITLLFLEGIGISSKIYDLFRWVALKAYCYFPTLSITHLCRRYPYLPEWVGDVGPVMGASEGLIRFCVAAGVVD
jgi:hypothetical protein